MPDETNASEAAFHREAARLLARVEVLRKAQDANPTDPPLGLSDDDLARRLSWDMVTTLTRSAVVFDAGIPAVVAYTEALLEANALKREELAIRAREVARAEAAAEAAKERDARVWSTMMRCIGGAYSWAGSILGTREMKFAIVSAITGALGTLGAIITGYLASTGWLSGTP